MDPSSSSSCQPPSHDNHASSLSDQNHERLPEFKDQTRNFTQLWINNSLDLQPMEMGSSQRIDANHANHSSPNAGLNHENGPALKDQVREVRPQNKDNNNPSSPAEMKVKPGYPELLHTDVEFGVVESEYSHVRRPGAIHVDRNHQEILYPRVSSTQQTDVINVEATVGTGEVTNSTQDAYPVQAELVTELAQEAIPMRSVIKWTRRRFLFLLLFATVFSVAIVMAALIGNNKVKNSTSSKDGIGGENFNPNTETITPSSTATSTPPIDWIPVGLDIVGYSDDDVGTAVAISRHGNSIAVGGPGRTESVQVFRWLDQHWMAVAEIDITLGDSSDPDGEYEMYRDIAFGRSVSLDDSGSIVAVGIPGIRDDYDRTGNTTTGLPGRVRVHKLNETAISNLLDNYDPYSDTIGYYQLGSDIMGEGPDDEFGWSVDLSGDGNVIAIGSRKKCLVKVLSYSKDDDDWIPRGQEFNCTDPYNDLLGASVSLSSDGTILAVGLPNDVEIVGDSGYIGGHVQIYQFDDETEGGTWKPMGQTLVGEMNGDGLGSSLSLSDDGMVIAIGSPFNDVNLESHQGTIVDPSIGSCRIYEFDVSGNQWRQRGSDIDGEALFDFFGSSVSLSANGDVVAVGAKGSNDNGDDSGHVRVYQYDSDANQWHQVGHDIAGPFAFAQAGVSVALSANGDTVVVGAPHPLVEATTGNDRSGIVQVFETGVLSAKGNFPVTFVVQSDLWGQDILLSLERMDAEFPTLVTNVLQSELEPEVDDEYLNVTDVVDFDFNMTVMIAENGVYRLVLYKKYFWESEYLELESDGWYRIVLSADATDEVQTLVQVPGNFTSQSQYTFETKLLNATPIVPSGESFVTLVIDFDDRPQDIHWFLIVKYNISTADPVPGQSTKQRTIVAFGPDQEYASEYAGQTWRETINVSSVVLAGAEFEFILTDDGRDGLCCTNGEGKYELYAENSRLLFSSTAEGNRREVHRFVLAP